MGREGRWGGRESKEREGKVGEARDREGRRKGEGKKKERKGEGTESRRG